MGNRWYLVSNDDDLHESVVLELDLSDGALFRHSEAGTFLDCHNVPVLSKKWWAHDAGA